MVFCRVDSWFTGHRLVSLPFSDHCEPLIDTPENASFLICSLQDSLQIMGCDYLEIRLIDAGFNLLKQGIDLGPVTTYFFHSLDLGPDLGELFLNFDKDSVQRRIRRAERAGLLQKCGTSHDLLTDFYHLFTLTRRRHHLPPTPYAWFANLVDCQGKILEIRLAYKEKIPIAAVITLRFRDVVYYKYGCSDTRFNKFGAVPWLLWQAISNARLNAARKFDFGRTEANSLGLLAFKNHWVRHPGQLAYCRLPKGCPSFDSAESWKLKMARRTFSHMPDWLLVAAGKLLYRHFA